MISVACEMPFYGTGECNMLSKEFPRGPSVLASGYWALPARRRTAVDPRLRTRQRARWGVGGRREGRRDSRLPVGRQVAMKLAKAQAAALDAAEWRAPAEPLCGRDRASGGQSGAMWSAGAA